MVTSTAIAAPVAPGTKQGAQIAGSFVAITEACFSNSKGVLTSKARQFAAASKKTNPKMFDEQYGSESSGSDAYDEATCNQVDQREYGPNGETSKKVGFQIWDTSTFAE